MSKPKKTLLAITCLGSFLLMVPALAAWLVNLEAAARVFIPTLNIAEHYLPAAAFAFFNSLALDLSTVSTLVPFLMLFFLWIQTQRVLIRQKHDPAFAHRLEADPYPPHFGFFLVMLGLAGTLYGLLIGLDISGVGELTDQAPSADSIRQSLDRLLAGTATALLSSLVGLIGAFLVARPIPWLFRLGTGIETDESRRTLTETVERLTEDMRGLSKASRTFAAHLKIDAANNIFARLDRQEHTLENIEKTLGTMAKTIETIPPALENSNAELQKIDALESALNSLLETSRENLRQQQASAEIQQKTNQTLEQILASQTSQNDNTRQALTEMVTIAKASREQLKNSQQKLRQALAVYAADSD